MIVPGKTIKGGWNSSFQTKERPPAPKPTRKKP